MAEAIEYVHGLGVKVSRQTVYSWARNGRKGVRLRTETLFGRLLLTRKEFVDAFIRDSGLGRG